VIAAEPDSDEDLDMSSVVTEDETKMTEQPDDRDETAPSEIELEKDGEEEGSSVDATPTITTSRPTKPKSEKIEANQKQIKDAQKNEKPAKNDKKEKKEKKEKEVKVKTENKETNDKTEKKDKPEKKEKKSKKKEPSEESNPDHVCWVCPLLFCFFCLLRLISFPPCYHSVGLRRNWPFEESLQDFETSLYSFFPSFLLTLHLTV
jgi:hypothetical protein